MRKPLGIYGDGRLSHWSANAWADQLEYGGYDDWRLPSAGNPPTNGVNLTTGELGHMFYNNLGNTAGHSILNNVSFIYATPGGGTVSFLNVQLGAHWLGEMYAPNYKYFWAFNTGTGSQTYLNRSYSYYSWAVRDGDVSSVPVPTAAWLFGSALAGLLVARDFRGQSPNPQQRGSQVHLKVAGVRS